MYYNKPIKGAVKMSPTHHSTDTTGNYRIYMQSSGEIQLFPTLADDFRYSDFWYQAVHKNSWDGHTYEETEVQT